METLRSVHKKFSNKNFDRPEHSELRYFSAQKFPAKKFSGRKNSGKHKFNQSFRTVPAPYEWLKNGKGYTITVKKDLNSMKERKKDLLGYFFGFELLEALVARRLQGVIDGLFCRRLLVDDSDLVTSREEKISIGVPDCSLHS